MARPTGRRAFWRVKPRSRMRPPAFEAAKKKGKRVHPTALRWTTGTERQKNAAVVEGEPRRPLLETMRQPGEGG
ncbi:hypothetical protein BQ8794_450003 [Mesorhizobium prunaredense]|uniref:Uncharacterized protein n=1 Tax=Mesorhizobium prunaredense TaxID=1631249 RepID=A0A1R3VD64_9HYPH|nr:hypothetical protein BQ8794_450003 [Mesorhizobium prunaredense]